MFPIKNSALALVLFAGCIIDSTHSFSTCSTSAKAKTSAVGAASSRIGARHVGGPRISSLSFIAGKYVRSSALFMASSGAPLASDGEALQSLFAKHCNDEGLMTEEMLRNVPAIKDMLEQGELLSSELTEMWKAAPKFPQVEAAAVDDKIDVDSFIQVYRDIDDLFDEDDSEAGGDDVAVADTENTAASAIEEEADDEGLTKAFATLIDGGKSVSFSQLRQWEEITSLIDEGALGEDEFVTLWETSVGVKGRDINMDLEAFVKFNNALDDLFEFDDEELLEVIADVSEDVSGEEEEAPAQATFVRPIITEEDLPAGALFSQLSNENYLVGQQELARWGEVNDMIKEGDVTMDELNTLFDSVSKAPGTTDMLDEDGFCALYDAIDNLFEDDDGEEGTPEEYELREELLELLGEIDKLQEEQGNQMCGMDCSEEEQERVIEIVSELEREPYNQVLTLTASGSGAIEKQELVGTWDLLYSSSSTMKYNEGLSGLAGGLTKFGGVQQELSATKYLQDVEYTEQVISKVGGKELEVKITGDWDLRTEVSLFTGKPSNILFVTPDKVAYGPRSDKADHWKSLGPMNLLVLSYLDEDLRIMRGNTSTDTIFIWRRSK